ncbi:type I secretion system permease/ATPase [Methylobacterium bullatum]|uniref:Toxin RTX-I translocation ATP-binding protein n=1 Tax=Methylobacterium bullatum TaxID=570505 RepID=A0A679K0M3_9HYPH|nr:Toxin RTX-I translocation ATP-binding protein [Methylobacterium bullatum]
MDISATNDAGLASLVTVLRFHGIPADSGQLQHRAGGALFGVGEIVRGAREHGLKARVRKTVTRQLPRHALPAIVRRTDGSFVLLAKIVDDTVLLHDPVNGRPSLMAMAEFASQWDGTLILMARRARLSDLTRRFDITWFLQAMHKYRGLLTEVLVASLFIQVFALITPVFFQVVIDKVLVHRGITTLDLLVIGLLVVGTFESVLSGLRTYLFAHTTNRIDVELGARLFRHLLALPIGYFEARRTGDSVARVRELENIRNFLTSSSLTLVVDLAFTSVFLGVMFYYSALLSWIVIASIPVYIAISVLLSPLFRRRLEEKFNRGAENQAFLVESLTGIETLKAMAIEPQMQRRWEEQLAGYVGASFRVLSLGNTASQTIQFVSKVVTAGILFFGAKAVIGGDMTVGELVAFNMLAGRVAQPVLRLAQVYQDFHQARVSIDRLGDILNAAPEPAYSPGSAALPAIRGAIAFDHVTFRYRPDGPPVLHDICIEIEPGQVVGIVGPSGSGKSTLTKLVQRLYVPEGGRVLVDRIDIGVVDASWLRRQIGVVLQENVLFNRSIRDNIALADPGLPMDRIIAAAELAGAHEFIATLPHGYDTIVGERGTSLSGGQRQRIAIARALIGDPRILIFDEATSALDYESERIIQDNMRRIAKGRTVVIIAHRLSTVRHANRILTLERGRLVEDGSHDELIVCGGRYASLYRMQDGLHEAV